VDAGTGVQGGVAAHAAVDRVQGGHQPAAAVGVSRVGSLGLPGANRARLGEHDATRRVTGAGAVEPPQGGGDRAGRLGRVAGAVRKPEIGRGSLECLSRGEGAVMQEDQLVPGAQPVSQELLGGTAASVSRASATYPLRCKGVE
jgi:hypothetical protein